MTDTKAGGVELPLSDAVIDALVAELPEVSCRDLLRRLLRERRGDLSPARRNTMNASFNDTLDNIKRTLNMAQNCHEESETTGSLAYAESAMKRAAALYDQTAVTNAVFQTEIMLVIADSLVRIADVLDGRAAGLEITR